MSNQSAIRNFSIIAHIDHGKSTLADRMLEVTHTVEKRLMTDQVLDSMELEKERGITIKMQPVRMKWQKDATEYILNLIDTPGHIDFSYEVSRAMKAVEGSLLLVDSTQGVQAQTFTVLEMARESGLTIIPVITKVDSPLARVDDCILDICQILNCGIEDVCMVSGKTGEGVPELLNAIIARIPAPSSEEKSFRSIVFDYEYSNHQGIIVYTRVIDGTIKRGDAMVFRGSRNRFVVSDLGTFSPSKSPANNLSAGEIGYLVTGIKEASFATVGDTITATSSTLPVLDGYTKPVPMIWASVYPESQDDFLPLRSAMERLKLSDSSLVFEEENSGILGRGFRCGFLGMLHLEIVTERLKREYELELIITAPSVTYEVQTKRHGIITVYSPHLFPDHGEVESVREPWVMLTVLVPADMVGTVLQLFHDHEGEVTNTISKGKNAELVAHMPLRELMRNFFDELKSTTSGYASLSYEPLDYRPASVERMDILVGDEIIPAFTKITASRRIMDDADAVVEKLSQILPKQLFVLKIQAKAHGKIIASRTLSAMRKDVTGYLYGGDITRKRKLLEKQKKGKKKMEKIGKSNISIPQDVFLKMMKQ